MRIFNINLFKNRNERLNDKLVEHTLYCNKIKGNLIYPEIYAEKGNKIYCKWCNNFEIIK